MAALRVHDLEPDDRPVTIAPMRRRHLRSVLRIENQGDHQGWSLGLFMSELSHRDTRIYLVAKVDHSVVGFAGLLLAATDGHVTTVAVDPRWRRRTIATRMLLVLCRRAIERGAEALTLEVRASNQGALELYRRFGFAPAGVRKGYYSDVGEDAIVMWATDVQHDDYAARLQSVEDALTTPTIIEPVGW